MEDSSELGHEEGVASIGGAVLQHMGELSPAERRVARVLLASYPIAGLETVAKLAERADVSGPTVVRFVTKLGFGGYPEFQAALHVEVQARLSSPTDLLARRSSGRGHVISDIESQSQEGIAQTFHHLPPDEFDRTLDLLADRSNRIACLGGRHSQALALALFEQLHAIRPKCRLIGGSPTPRVDELLDLNRRDLLVVFDYRRYQRDTIEFAKEAASRGSRIVLFTDPWLSPIAEFADAVLPASVETASPLDSMVAAMALVEAVVAGLVVVLGDAAIHRIDRVEEARTGFAWAQDPPRPEG